MIVQGVSPSSGVKDPSKMTDAELDHFLAGASYGKQVASGQVSGMNVPQKDPSQMSDAELDSFLASKQPPWIDQPGTAQNISKGFINALPAVGGIGGGLLGGAAGTAAGPVGTAAGSVGGAGLGYGAGESLKNTLYSALGSKEAPQTHEEALAGPLKAIPTGAAAEMGGQLIGAGVSKVGPRVLSALTGAPEQDVNTLLAKPDKILSSVKETGGQVSNNIDQVRREATESLKNYKQGVNKQIGDILEKSPSGKSVDATSILDSLRGERAKLDPDLEPEGVAEINDIIDRVSKKLGDDGKSISVQDANNLRGYLGKLSKGVQPKPGGERVLFQPQDPGARAAKAGSAAARGLLEESAPQVTDELSKLRELRELSRNSPGLLREGANDAGFLRAGRGADQRHIDTLNKIDELTGGNALEQAQELSATKTFGDAKLNPLSFVYGGFLKNPAVLRGAVGINQALGGAPSAAAQFSSRPIIQNMIQHRPDVKTYPHLGK